MFIHHDDFVDEAFAIGPNECLFDSNGEVIYTADQMRTRATEGLRSHRGWMRERGLEPPELPSELAYIEAGPK